MGRDFTVRTSKERSEIEESDLPACAARTPPEDDSRKLAPYFSGLRRKKCQKNPQSGQMTVLKTHTANGDQLINPRWGGIASFHLNSSEEICRKSCSSWAVSPGARLALNEAGGQSGDL